MITRIYKKACDHCSATGYVISYYMGTANTGVCPVCNGAETMDVTELIPEQESKLTANKDLLIT